MPSALAQNLLIPLLTEPVIDFWAARLNRTWSLSRTLARVLERRVEASDTVTLILKPNRHFRGFQPGQHVNVTVEVNGRRLTRSYSLSDIPRADGRLAITVKRVEGGRVSTQLTQCTRPGDVLELGPAFGELTLPEHPEGRWLFLAAGSGVTPLMSLTRALAARDMPVPLTLMLWARTRAELAFADELQTLAAQHPRFRLILALTRDEARGDDVLGTRLSELLLAAAVPDLAQHQVYACGPAGFVQTARTLCGSARCFRAEAFSPPEAATLSDATGTVRVHLERSGQSLELPRSLSLLEGLESMGLQPAHGCRMGICNTCACAKSSGSTEDLRTGERFDDASSALRLCINRPCTDLSLDL